MKFKVEARIPLRQYEFLNTSYECEHSEKDKAIEMALDDLRRYHQITQKETPLVFYRPKEGEEVAILDKGIIKEVCVFKDGHWEVRNK